MCGGYEAKRGRGNFHIKTAEDYALRFFIKAIDFNISMPYNFLK